jgi:hypothetical protein
VADCEYPIRDMDGVLSSEITAARDTLPAPDRLRWRQFRLWSLFRLILLASIGMSWVAVGVQRSRRQWAAKALVHLLGLTNLRRLVLKDTRVSDAGAQGLQHALPNCVIER